MDSVQSVVSVYILFYSIPCHSERIIGGANGPTMTEIVVQSLIIGICKNICNKRDLATISS